MFLLVEKRSSRGRSIAEHIRLYFCARCSLFFGDKHGLILSRRLLEGAPTKLYIIRLHHRCRMPDIVRIFTLVLSGVDDDINLLFSFLHP